MKDKTAKPTLDPKIAALGQEVVADVLAEPEARQAYADLLDAAARLMPHLSAAIEARLPKLVRLLTIG